MSKVDPRRFKLRLLKNLTFVKAIAEFKCSMPTICLGIWQIFECRGLVACSYVLVSLKKIYFVSWISSVKPILSVKILYIPTQIFFFSGVENIEHHSLGLNRVKNFMIILFGRNGSIDDFRDFDSAETRNARFRWIPNGRVLQRWLHEFTVQTC